MNSLTAGRRSDLGSRDQPVVHSCLDAVGQDSDEIIVSFSESR